MSLTNTLPTATVELCLTALNNHIKPWMLHSHFDYRDSPVLQHIVLLPDNSCELFDLHNRSFILCCLSDGYFKADIKTAEKLLLLWEEMEDLEIKEFNLSAEEPLNQAQSDQFDAILTSHSDKFKQVVKIALKMDPRLWNLIFSMCKRISPSLQHNQNQLIYTYHPLVEQTTEGGKHKSIEYLFKDKECYIDFMIATLDNIFYNDDQDLKKHSLNEYYNNIIYCDPDWWDLIYYNSCFGTFGDHSIRYKYYALEMQEKSRILAKKEAERKEIERDYFLGLSNGLVEDQVEKIIMGGCVFLFDFFTFNESGEKDFRLSPFNYELDDPCLYYCMVSIGQEGGKNWCFYPLLAKRLEELNIRYEIFNGVIMQTYEMSYEDEHYVEHGYYDKEEGIEYYEDTEVLGLSMRGITASDKRLEEDAKYYYLKYYKDTKNR